MMIGSITKYTPLFYAIGKIIHRKEKEKKCTTIISHDKSIKRFYIILYKSRH